MTPLASIVDIMTADPSSVSSKDSVAEAKARMAAVGCRHLPVIDQGQLVGVLSVRDLSGGAATVGEVMTPNPITILKTDRADVAAATMALAKVSCLLVLDGNSVVGIVTTYDLLDAFAKYTREREAPR